MWNYAPIQVTRQPRHRCLLPILAGLVLLVAAPTLAQTDTPTPTATAAPAPDYTCVFDIFFGNDPLFPSPYDGIHLYFNFPANNHLAGEQLHPQYTDPNCEDKADWISYWGSLGGLANANDRDAAWDICVANNTNKVTDIQERGVPKYWCLTSDEPAPPGGYTERFIRVGYAFPSPPDYTPLTAAEALAECKLSRPDVTTVVYTWGARPGSWVCLVSWTVQATPTPDPNGNSGSDGKVEELIVFGHGFGRTADAGLTECQRKWSDTDAISRHPTLERYWACLKSQTEQSETPTPTATATATETSTATATNTHTATATDTPTPTATVAPAPDYTCVLDAVYDGQSLYIKFPENSHLAENTLFPYYIDAICEAKPEDGHSYHTIAGGIVAARDRDTAWDICIANNTKKVIDLFRFSSNHWRCRVSDEPAPPGGQTQGFWRVGYVWPSPPDNKPLTAEEALAECQLDWPNVNSVAYNWWAPPGS